jgi:RNA polymerase sigma-70 factor (ECF subfamily)
MSQSATDYLTALTDEELITRFQLGDEDAFVALVRRYKDPLTNYVYRFLGGFDEANDIVQDTFLRLYQHRHNYQSEGKFAVWLYTIASNIAKSELRRGGRKYCFSMSGIYGGQGNGEREWDVLDPELGPDAQVDTTFRARLVQKALMQISSSFREVVILRDIQDMSYEEIAEITGLEMGTVKSRINRGRAQLQKLLRNVLQEDAGRKTT